MEAHCNIWKRVDGEKLLSFMYIFHGYGFGIGVYGNRSIAACRVSSDTATGHCKTRKRARMLLVGHVELMLHVLLLSFLFLGLHCTQQKTAIFPPRYWNDRENVGRSQMAIARQRPPDGRSAGRIDPCKACGILAFRESIPADRQLSVIS